MFTSKNNKSIEFFLPVSPSSDKYNLILLLSFIIGFISGLFGIGGGFLMTPVLIFLGIPPAFAVANEANNILGTSVSGALHHWFEKRQTTKWVCSNRWNNWNNGRMLIFAYLKEKGVINVRVL